MFATLAMLGACSSTGGEGDAPDVPPTSFQVCIDLSVPALDPESRASTGFDNGRANPYENYIDVDGGNYRFYAFTLDNKYIATLNVEEIVPLETPETSSKTYQLMANFDEDPGHDFKIVALANWPEYFDTANPGILTPGMVIENLVGDISANFNVDPVKAPAADNLIPMFGVKEYSDIEFSAMRVWLGSLHMLRAISKIEVGIATNASPKIHLNSLQLHNYYTVGVAMPALDNYVQTDYVSSRFDLDYLRHATMRFDSNNPVHTVLDLTDRIVDDKVTFFLPETRLTENYSLMGVPYSYDHRTRMTATFTMEGNDSFDTTHSYDIEFKFYDEAAATASGAMLYDYFDIMRNYFYRFAVKSVSGADISLYADVVPYTEVILKPNFGFPLGEGDEEEIKPQCGCTENGGVCHCSPDCGCCDHSSNP